jgi:hypothetical protein
LYGLYENFVAGAATAVADPNKHPDAADARALRIHAADRARRLS